MRRETAEAELCRMACTLRHQSSYSTGTCLDEAYVRNILLDPRSLSRPYVQRHMVEAVVRHHLGGSRNFTSELHTLLTLELLHRVLIDGSPARAVA